MTPPPAVGFIGLGAMGARMAQRLIDAGHPLVVHDRDASASARLEAAGARSVASPREVADTAAIVFVSLPTPAIVEEVALGADGIVHGTAVEVYVDLSTTGPVVGGSVARALSERGVGVVDAPVSGGPAGAAAGTLTFMVAGEDATVTAVRPLLELLAKRIFVVGSEPGQGQMTKVINNLISAACIAITSEATVLGARAGLDVETLLEVIAVSSGANNAASDKFPKQVLTRRFDHGFRLELMAKDVALCLEAARARNVPMVLGGAVDELWRLAGRHEDDGADCTAYARMIEDWGGTTIGPPDTAEARSPR